MALHSQSIRLAKLRKKELFHNSRYQNHILNKMTKQWNKSQISMVILQILSWANLAPMESETIMCSICNANSWTTVRNASVPSRPALITVVSVVAASSAWITTAAGWQTVSVRETWRSSWYSSSTWLWLLYRQWFVTSTKASSVSSIVKTPVQMSVEADYPT